MENEFVDKNQLDELLAAAEEKTEKKKKKKTKNVAKKATRKGPNAFIQILNGDFLTKEFMLNNLNLF